MPYRRKGSFRRGLSLRPVDSIKNVLTATVGLTGTQTNQTIAKAVNTPLSASAPEEVSHGCSIKAIWLSLDTCGLGGTGVLNNFDGYLFKNPGANLTPPLPISQGNSNEKKFIVKSWHGMIMRSQDGVSSLHWEGWIKIPRRYHRMGTDDLWQLVVQSTSGVTGHFSVQAIYKWYR